MTETPIIPGGRSGSDLYALVEQYDALGIHRTGTPTDSAATDWFRSLVSGDADVREETYTFDRFDVHSEVIADGEHIDHLPLYYEAVGSTTTTEPMLSEVDTIANFVAPQLAERMSTAVESGADALVVATRCSDDALVALNRKPTLGDGTPVLLVAGRDYERLRAATTIVVDHHASINPAESANIVARAGDRGPSVVLTTPLTGWWHCAGERGPGIAMAADLFRRLATVAQVSLLATTGHELQHIGARHWLDGEGRDSRPDIVVHLGASIATGPPTEGHATSIRTAAPTHVDTALGHIFELAHEQFVGSPDTWLSEAKEWLDRTDRLMSFAGTFRWFHTPEDRVAVSTRPEWLGGASQRLDRAVEALLSERR